MPVTAIVLQTITFEEWLKAGHRFASTVWQSAARIYDPRNFSWTNPNGIINMALDKECEHQYIDRLTKAKEFLAGSELFRVRKQYAMAAFMSHQSAEQALRTLLKWVQTITLIPIASTG